MSKELYLVKAAPMPGMEVKDLVIKVQGDGLTPTITSENWEREHAAFYDEQAGMLERALFSHLPGGTTDRLIAKMMTRRATLFRVPLIEDPK